MKAPLIFLAFTAAVSLGAEPVSEDSRAAVSIEQRRANALSEKFARFETMKGRVYKDVRITAIDAGGVSLSHSSGTARLRFGDLSPQQRQHFGIEEQAAAETYRQETLAREAYEKRVAEKQAARREAAIAAEHQRRLAEEKVEAARALAEANRPLSAAEKIPTRPNIQRVDTLQRSSRYSSYGSSYGYHPYSYYQPYYSPRRHSSGHHFGNHGYRHRTPGLIIRF